MSVLDVDTIYIQPGEVRPFDFEFADKLARGETINSIVSGITVTAITATGSVSVLSTTYSGSRVQGMFSAVSAVDGDSFAVKVRVGTTVASKVVEGDGVLVVRDE